VPGFSAAGGGYAFGPLSRPLRAALFCLSPLLIDPDSTTDSIGGVGVALVRLPDMSLQAARAG
jgi:hypothetical protein